MKNAKLMIAMSVIGVASTIAHAADEQSIPEARKAQAASVTGFGSGNGMGAGGGFGSSANVVNSRSFAAGNNGNQSFGGGFDRQQSHNAGPLSTNRGASANAAIHGGSNGAPVLTSPNAR